MMTREEKKLLGQLGESTKEMMEAYNVIIAGGALTAIYTNQEINDIDVYFRSEDDFLLFVSECFDGEFSLICTNIAEKSVTFLDKETQAVVQLIHFDFFDNAHKIFKKFDFTINMCAYDFKTKSIVQHCDFLKHCCSRYLCFNSDTSYPIISLLRANKYQQRGYNLSKPEMLRIALTVSQMDIRSWKQLKTHLGGMYGLDMDEIFPEDDEFDIHKAIGVLSEINPECDFWHPLDHHSSSPINDILRPYYEKYAKGAGNPEPCEERMFKIIKKDFTSVYDNSFSYKNAIENGEYVDGGRFGVFFYYGHDVLTGIHSNLLHHGDDPLGIIIELGTTEGCRIERSSLTGKWCIKGKVRCISSWSLVEFTEKFGSGSKDSIGVEDVLAAKQRYLNRHNQEAHL